LKNFLQRIKDIHPIGEYTQIDEPIGNVTEVAFLVVSQFQLRIGHRSKFTSVAGRDGFRVLLIRLVAHL